VWAGRRADDRAIDQALAFDKKGEYDKENQLLRPLAERGVPRAQFDLGGSYANGQGVTKDDARAMEWYRKAADQGFAPAQDAVGYMYATGKGVAKDDAQAAAWWRKAAAQGNTDAQASLMELQTMVSVQRAEELVKQQDYSAALKLIQPLADKGIAEAQLDLGTMYENGRAVTKDDVQAVIWYRKAADQGNPVAQLNLGWAYDSGQGVAKDETQAIVWYRKAAEQGNASAQNNIAYMYSEGKGVTKDAVQAVAWYRKAAEQGNISAQKNLAGMYAVGQGVEKDNAKVVYWYSRAKAQENAAAAAVAVSQGDYPQRYAGGIADSFLGGPACELVKSSMLHFANSIQTPDNIRIAQIDSLVREADRAHCLREQ